MNIEAIKERIENSGEVNVILVKPESTECEYKYLDFSTDSIFDDIKNLIGCENFSFVPAPTSSEDLITIVLCDHECLVKEETKYNLQVGENLIFNNIIVCKGIIDSEDNQKLRLEGFNYDELEQVALIFEKVKYMERQIPLDQNGNKIIKNQKFDENGQPIPMEENEIEYAEPLYDWISSMNKAEVNDFLKRRNEMIQQAMQRMMEQMRDMQSPTDDAPSENKDPNDEEKNSDEPSENEKPEEN